MAQPCDIRLMLMNSVLVGTLEISHLLGVSRQRADQLTKTDEMFPEPAADLAGGRVWYAEAVVVWARFRDRPVHLSSGMSSVVHGMAMQGVADAARVLLLDPTEVKAQTALRVALERWETGQESAPASTSGR
jgi:hypothetical protein